VEDTDFFTIQRQCFKPLLYNEIVDDEEEFELPEYHNIIVIIIILLFIINDLHINKYINLLL